MPSVQGPLTHIGEEHVEILYCIKAAMLFLFVALRSGVISQPIPADLNATVCYVLRARASKEIFAEAKPQGPAA
jgi:hypothetical protein